MFANKAVQPSNPARVGVTQFKILLPGDDNDDGGGISGTSGISGSGSSAISASAAAAAAGFRSGGARRRLSCPGVEW
jgi:hypothetical protein